MQKLNILPSLNVRLHINYQLQLPIIQYKNFWQLNLNYNINNMH